MIKPDDVGYTKYSQAQAFFQASMNFSADPCNNFYEYSCGAYNDMVSFGKIYQRNAKVMAKMLDDMLDGNYKGVSNFVLKMNVVFNCFKISVCWNLCALLSLFSKKI